jgi:flagellar protein FliS
MDGKIQAYRHADTMGKSQLELILMVYDGAIKACHAAAARYQEDDSNGGFEEIRKVKKFVTHLYTTLDPGRGGEVAENLSRMYVYVLTQCYVIEATKDFEQLKAITTILRNLRSAWVELRDREESARPGPSAEPIGVETEPLEDFVTTA